MTTEEKPQQYPKAIRIVSIQNIALGQDCNSNSVDGYFPVTVAWCDPQTDEHIALSAPEELTYEDTIRIKDISPHYIETGVYERLTDSYGQVYFQKTILVQT